MTEARQATFDPGAAKSVAALSSSAPSPGDHALYIMEMSSELARIAYAAGLPDTIGFTLRIAAQAAQDHAKELGRSGPGTGRPIP